MNLADNLKEAIQTKNWNLVSKVYNILTGEKLYVSDLQCNFDFENFKRDIEEIFNKYETSPKKQKEIDYDDDDDDDDKHEQIIQATIKKNIYNNNPTELITDKIIPEEQQINIQKAEKRSKSPRPEPKKYKVKCSDCEKEFDIPFKLTSDDIGMCCPSCVKNKRKDKE